ncbi:biosynthetic-type acetolactate synthase large subunit [Miniphocaeibacter halophilus]|uniref:Biosynthetic-type acetolactate synthase large subunit n=1 Tax=Miniphocaeibacter halophilus TaxID=2931922 RepID=A0AC61MR45_9FIRM|nr:biosynthetic-type acetolactate synthase large subunit [Miniphocaeibacter halophilus]QQK08082.1 biosynthetic-type acetolactate synthase large subunit [Miniphocaeibacter halophilus]
MKGSDFLLKCLKAEGVNTVFGYPGGAVIPLFDALYRDGTFKIYRTSHEQGATHAADGFARRSGKTGVCIATSGPGATNTITGIATAYSDSIPLVVITGQVGQQLLGKNSFQEVDTTGITMSITKYNVLVTDPYKIGEAIQMAFNIARSGRPGPVVVDITKDVLEKEIEDYDYKSLGIDRDERHLDYINNIKKACDLIKNAKRPIIYAGGGVIRSNSSELLRKLANNLNIPVMNSIMGMGAFDMTDEKSYGIVGMHGQKITNMMVYKADVILGIGVRFSDRAIGHRRGFSENAKVIHIDVDGTEFNKNIEAEVEILGNFNEILKIMIDELKDVHFKMDFNHEKLPKSEENFLPKRYIEKIEDIFTNEAVVVTDVGQHQMWTMMYWKAKYPNRVITSGGQGTMGFGVGAAIGAKIAKPETPVILITGDGSFRMNHNEVLTLSTYKIPITIFVFNNNTLGMVRQWQGIFENERYSETDIYDALDFKYLAKAYGVNYAGKVANEEELEKALCNCDLKNGINIVECMIDHDDWAYPMVAAGSSINNIIERN